MSLTIESCNHVSVQTKRLEDSLRFYVDVLGAKPISRPAFSFRGAWLYIGGIQIHLIEDEAAGDPGGEIYTRAAHVAFATPDVDEAERRLIQMGVPYKRKLIADRGVHQLFVHDPDGNMIEVGKYGRIDE